MTTTPGHPIATDHGPRSTEDGFLVVATPTGTTMTVQSRVTVSRVSDAPSNWHTVVIGAPTFPGAPQPHVTQEIARALVCGAFAADSTIDRLVRSAIDHAPVDVVDAAGRPLTRDLSGARKAITRYAALGDTSPTARIYTAQDQVIVAAPLSTPTNPSFLIFVPHGAWALDALGHLVADVFEVLDTDRS